MASFPKSGSRGLPSWLDEDDGLGCQARRLRERAEEFNLTGRNMENGMGDRGIGAARARAAELGMDVSVIPDGPYCYSRARIERADGGIPTMKVVPCPYWGRDGSRDQQESGYCAFLGAGDWEGPMGLLWDQVKECGIRDGMDDGEPGPTVREWQAALAGQPDGK